MVSDFIRAILMPTIATIGASLRWAFDPRTRRPLVVLAIVVLGIAFSGLAIDLFRAIPWPTRKLGGWALFSCLLAWGLARLVRVGPGDRPIEIEGEQVSRTGRWAWTLAPLAIGAMAWPYLQGPENLGAGDWDLFLGKAEAARRTILEWGQFPWWDPWTRGGFPLAANPQCGVIGVAMPMVLAFGTSVGMRLATLACFLIAAEGGRRLAGLWLADGWAASAAGLIYAINGGVVVAAVAAYHVSMCYGALPWLLLLASRLDRRPADGLWLGFWLAFNVLNGIQYFTVYIALIVGAWWLRNLRLRSGAARSRYLAHTAIGLGTFFALAGWRLATTGLVYRDFPRPYQTAWEETPWSIVRHLIGRPSAETLIRMEVPYFWETSCSIGPLVLGLALVSLAWGWRWWHGLALVCGWLAAGSTSWYYPSYWLAHFPVFSTMHVVTRWRFMALLGVALAAASVLDRWRRDRRRGLRVLALVAIAAIGIDYTFYGARVLHLGFRVAPTEDHFPGPSVAGIVQVDTALGLPSIGRGYGVIHGFEPLMGYNRQAVTARLWRGQPDYQGEAWTDAGPIRPESWSPNRIAFRVEPGQVVHVNQNPGSWWLVDGRPIFDGLRCAEMERPFAVQAGPTGRLDLRIRPRGLGLGLGLHVAGVVLVVIAWSGPRFLGRRPDAGGSPTADSPARMMT